MVVSHNEVPFDSDGVSIAKTRHHEKHSFARPTMTSTGPTPESAGHGPVPVPHMYEKSEPSVLKPESGSDLAAQYWQLAQLNLLPRKELLLKADSGLSSRNSQ